MVMTGDTPRVDDMETLAENFHGMTMAVNASFARTLEQELNEALHAQRGAEQSRDAILVNYNELLYAVARKFPNETRHQTALKYIQQMEQGCLDVTADQSAIAALKD